MSRVCEAEAMDSFGECMAYQSIVYKHKKFVDAPFVRATVRRSTGVKDLLDVGTGPGLIPVLISLARPEFNIRGMDISQNMLALARWEAELRGVQQRVLFEAGDAKDLPYDSHSFDMVISHAMLHHISDPVVPLREMARVLRPGGRLLLKDILRPPNWAIPIYVNGLGGITGYSREEKTIYEESLRAAFSVEEMKTLVGQIEGLQGATVTRCFITHYQLEWVKPL